ncbi:Uncharacterised protein [Streptococcus pneumoniae]|nr:Uncharacterised protein [Streptococcus pneumoniae]
MKVKLNDFMATVEVLDVKFSGVTTSDTLKTERGKTT